MRYAVVDTGSNTIRLGIYDYENGTLKCIYNKAVFANLASYIENNSLTQDGIEKAAEALLIHKKTAEEYGCALSVFATAAIRNARNCHEICKKIKELTNIDIDVLTGEDEALLSFYGAVSDFPVKDGVMADVGGGSSEIILFKNGSPVSFCSVPLGSLKAYKTFVSGNVTTETEAKNIKDEVFKYLSGHEEFLSLDVKNLCIVGGGVKSASALCKKLLNTDFEKTMVLNEILKIIFKDPEKSEDIIVTIAPERAKTVSPAISIYSAVSDFFNCENIFISDLGIKEGYILKKLV